MFSRISWGLNFAHDSSTDLFSMPNVTYRAPKRTQSRVFCMEKNVFFFEFPFRHEYNFYYKYCTVVVHLSTFRFFNSVSRPSIISQRRTFAQRLRSYGTVLNPPPHTSVYSLDVILISYSHQNVYEFYIIFGTKRDALTSRCARNYGRLL